MTPISQISRNLKRARENAGIDQVPAAKVLGIHEQTLSKYERGLVKKIPADVLTAAAKLYTVNFDQLVSGVIEKADSRKSATLGPFRLHGELPSAAAATTNFDSAVDQVVSEVAQLSTRFMSRKRSRAELAELTQLRRQLRAAVRKAFEAASGGAPQLDSAVDGMVNFLTGDTEWLATSGDVKKSASDESQ